jgi:hypothetical protein
MVQTMVFSDATPEEAFTFLHNRLQSVPPEDIQKAVECLGGRWSELETLISKVEAGPSIKESLNDMIARATVEVRKVGLGEDVTEAEAATMKWTPLQFWYLVKAVAPAGEV